MNKSSHKCMYTYASVALQREMIWISQQEHYAMYNICIQILKYACVLAFAVTHTRTSAREVLIVEQWADEDGHGALSFPDLTHAYTHWRWTHDYQRKTSLTKTPQRSLFLSLTHTHIYWHTQTLETLYERKMRSSQTATANSPSLSISFSHTHGHTHTHRRWKRYIWRKTSSSKTAAALWR